LHKPIEKELALLYNNVGTRYEDKILNTIAQEVSKAVLAKYNAKNILKKRESISD